MAIGALRPADNHLSIVTIISLGCTRYTMYLGICVWLSVGSIPFERQKQTTECHYLLYDSTYLITVQPFPISYFCIRIAFYSPKRTIYYPSVLAMSPREYYPTCNIIRVASRAGFPSQCNRKLGIPSITNRPQKFSFCFLAILICYFRKDFTAELGSL